LRVERRDRARASDPAGAVARYSSHLSLKKEFLCGDPS
jgi:hypothetical protein